jgi:hypothetical protein
VKANAGHRRGAPRGKGERQVGFGRIELARTALGIIFCPAALVIGWIELFFR